MMKINCKVCKHRTISLSTPKAKTLVVGIILLASAAANGTISPLLTWSQQQAFAQQAPTDTGLGSFPQDIQKYFICAVPLLLPPNIEDEVGN